MGFLNEPNAKKAKIVQETIFYVIVRALHLDLPNLKDFYQESRFREMSRRFANDFFAKKVNDHQFLVILSVEEIKHWIHNNVPFWIKEEKDENSQ